MGMGVLMGVRHAVVGVLVGMGVDVLAAHGMVVMNVHRKILLWFSFIIAREQSSVKTFISGKYPPVGLAQRKKPEYNG